jgi:hypothetical protein
LSGFVIDASVLATWFLEALEMAAFAEGVALFGA